MSPPALQRRGLLQSPRARLLLLCALAGLLAYVGLGLELGALIPKGSGTAILREFGAAALSPALDYEAAPPSGSPSFLWRLLDALRRTVVFAAAGMSLALLFAIPLGFATSRVWWSDARDAQSSPSWRVLRHTVAPALHALLRTLIACMRSVHELLWAVLLLTSMGLSTFSGVCAIAIPFTGVLAKVFSDLLDECPRDAAAALRQSGASGLQVFCFGLLPRALPDMSAYAFYRLECAVRSSAILGFFGFPTLGYFLKLSFTNKHYHEVWSYLYALIGLVVLLELWSGALRRRVVVR